MSFNRSLKKRNLNQPVTTNQPVTQQTTETHVTQQTTETPVANNRMSRIGNRAASRIRNISANRDFSSFSRAKTAYQRNMATPVQNNNWYSGTIPTTREIYAKIYSISQDNPEEAANIARGFFKMQETPASPWYNPYTRPTNTEALSTLSSYGVDVSNINEQWFSDNSWLTQYAPSNAKKASAEQKASWAYNKVADAYKNTKAVQDELSALQEEIDYLAGWQERNYSDDDIIGLIYGKDGSKFAKKYPTLAKLDASLGIGGDILSLNSGTDYSKDNVYTMIWRARNGGGSGNMFADSISSVNGYGNNWVGDPGVAEKLNKNNKDSYSPYSVGMTLQEEGMYFNVYEFTPEVIERIGRELDYDDATAVKYYQNVLAAEEKTKKLEEQLSDLHEWIDEHIGWGETADDIISSLYEEDDWGEDLDFNPYNFKDLFDLDDTMISTDLVGTTRAIDYKRSEVEKYIRDKCGSDGSAETVDQKVAGAFNPDQKTNTENSTSEAQDNLSEAAPIIALEATQAEKDAAFFGAVDGSRKSESVAVAGIGLTPEELQENYHTSIRNKANETYYLDYKFTSEYEAKQAEADKLREEIDASKKAEIEFQPRIQEYLTSEKGAIPYDAEYVANLPETYKAHLANYIRSDDLETKKEGYRLILEAEPFGDLALTNPGIFKKFDEIKDEAEFDAFIEEYPIVEAYAQGFMGNEPEGTVEYNGPTTEEYDDVRSQILNIGQLEDRLGKLEAELANDESAYNEAKTRIDSVRSDFDTYNQTSDEKDTYCSDIELWYDASSKDTPYGFASWTPYQDLERLGVETQSIQGAAAANIVECDYQIAKLEEMLENPQAYGYSILLSMSPTDREHVEQRIEVCKKIKEQATQYLVTTFDDFEEKAEAGKKIVPQSEVTRLNMNALLNGGDPRTTGLNKEWAKQFGMDSTVNAAHLAMGYVPLMTPAEIDGYFYRLVEFGEDTANEYFHNLVNEHTGVVMHRYADEQMKADEKYASSNKENAIWGYAESFAMNVLGGLQSLFNSFNNPTNTDPNGIRYSASNKRDALRSGVTTKFKAWLDKNNVTGMERKIAETMFEGSFSAGDSAINAVLTNGAFDLIGRALPALGRFMSWLQAGSSNKFVNFAKDAANSWLHALPMSMQAADNEYRRVIAENGTKEQAESMYYATLWAESATEAITYKNVNAMIQSGGTKNLSGFIGDLFQNGLEEAIGEGINEYWEATAEKHIMGAMSEYNRQVESLVESGIPRTKAEQIADKQIIKNSIKAAIQGFISSGYSQSFGYAFGAARKGYNSWQEKQANAMIQRDLIKIDAATGIVPEDTAALISGILQDDNLRNGEEEYQPKHAKKDSSETEEYQPKHAKKDSTETDTTAEPVEDSEVPASTETNAEGENAPVVDENEKPDVEAPKVTESDVTSEPSTTETTEGTVAPEETTTETTEGAVATEETAGNATVERPSKNRKKKVPSRTTETSSQETEATDTTTSVVSESTEVAKEPATETTEAPVEKKKLSREELQVHASDAAGIALVKMIGQDDAGLRVFRNLLAVSGASVVDFKAAIKLAALTSGRANKVLDRIVKFARAGGRITLADVNELVSAYEIDSRGDNNFAVALEFAQNVDNYMRSIGVLETIANDEQLSKEAKDAKKKVKQANRNAKRTKKTKVAADARVEAAQANLQAAVDRQLENPTKEGTAAVEQASNELEGAVRDQTRATEQAEEAEANAKEAKAEAKSTAKRVMKKARAKAQENVEQIRAEAEQEAQAEAEQTNAQRNPVIRFRRSVTKHLETNNKELSLTGVFAVYFKSETNGEGRVSNEIPVYIYTTPDGYVSDEDLKVEGMWDVRERRELDRAVSMNENRNPVKPHEWLPHSLVAVIDGNRVDVVGIAGQDNDGQVLAMLSDGRVCNYWDLQDVKDPFIGGDTEDYFFDFFSDHVGWNDLPTYDEENIYRPADAESNVQALRIVPAEYSDIAYDAGESYEYGDEGRDFEEAVYDPEVDGPDWGEEPPVEDMYARDVVMLPEVVEVNAKDGPKFVIGITTNNMGEIYFMTEDGGLTRGTVEPDMSDTVKEWFSRFSYLTMDTSTMRSPSTMDDIREFRKTLDGTAINLIPYNEDTLNKGYEAPEGTTAVYFGKEYTVTGVQRIGNNKIYYEVIPEEEDGQTLLDAEKVTSISNKDWAEAAQKALKKTVKNEEAAPIKQDFGVVIEEQKPVVKVKKENELPDDLKEKLDGIEFVDDPFYHVKYAAIPEDVGDTDYQKARIVGIGTDRTGSIIRLYIEDSDEVITEHSLASIAGVGKDATEFFKNRPALSEWILENFIPVAETGVKIEGLGTSIKENVLKNLRKDITGRETFVPKRVTPYVPTESDYSKGRKNTATGERLQDWQSRKYHGKVSPRSVDAESYLNKSKVPSSKEFKEFFENHNSFEAYKYTLDKKGLPTIFWRGIGVLSHHLYGVLESGVTAGKGIMKNFFSASPEGTIPYSSTGEVFKLRHINNWETARAAMQDIGYDLIQIKNDEGEMGYQVVTKTTDGYVAAYGEVGTFFKEDELGKFRRSYGGNLEVDGVHAGYIASEHPASIDANFQNWRYITATCTAPDGTTLTETMSTDAWANWAFTHGADALFIENVEDGGVPILEAITNKPNMFKSVWNNGEWNWENEEYLSLRTTEGKESGVKSTAKTEKIDGNLYTVKSNETVPETPTERHSRKEITELKSAQNIMQRLCKKLKIGNFIGTNEFGNISRNTKGYFDPHANYATTRVAEAGNPDTVVHELGHGLAKILKMTGTTRLIDGLRLINEEKAQNGERRIDLASYTPAQLSDEAFAEFVKYYLTDEQTARSMAGEEFYSQFESALAQDREVWKAVSEAKDEFTRLLLADFGQKLGAMIKYGKDKDSLTFRQFMQNAVGLMVDKSVAAENVMHLIRTLNGGKDLPITQNLRSMSLLTNHSQKQAIYMLTKNLIDADGTIVLDKEGNSLGFGEMMRRVGFTGTKENIKLLETYMLAKHSIARDEQGKPVYAEYVGGPKDRQAFINKIESTRPDVVGAAESFQVFRHNFLQKWMVDTGMWGKNGQALLDKFEEMYPNYVPTFRVGGNVDIMGAYGMKGGKKYNTYRAKGSTQDIYSPLYAFFGMVDQITSMVNMNRAAQTFDNLYRQYEGLGLWARKLPASADITASYTRQISDLLAKGNKNGEVSDDLMENILELTNNLPHQIKEGDNVLTIHRENGQVVKYQFSEEGQELFKLLAGVQQTSNIKALEVVGKLTRTMSMLTTGSNPLFAARNAVRDFQTSVNYGTWASNYAIGVKRWMQAFVEVARGKSEDVQQYFALGGGGWTRIDRNNRKSMEEVSGEVFTSDKSKVEKARELWREDRAVTGSTVKWAMRALWKTVTMETLNEWIEQTSRFAEYKYGKHDLSTVEGRQEAFLASQDVTVDFSRSGNSELASILKKLVPFFGASTQGVYRTARQFSEAERGMIGETFGETAENFINSNAARRLAKTVINTALASALSSLLILKFGDDDDKDEFANIMSSGIKADHLILPNPFSGFGNSEKNGEPPYIRIPLAQDPLGYAVHAAVTNALWNGTSDEYAISLAATADVILDNLNPLGSGTVAQPFIDVSHNRTWYGSALVRSAMTDWTDPSGQYNEDTPYLFRTIGRLFNTSPEIVEYLATQYTGFIGSIAIPALTPDEQGRANGLGGVLNGVKKKWTADPYSSNDATSRFYDYAANLETIKGEAKQDRPQGLLLRSLTQDQVNAAYLEAETMLSSKGVISTTKKAISESYAEIDKINANDSLTDSQKAKLVRDVRKEMTDTVEEANRQLEIFEKKYIKGESLTDLIFGGLIKGVEEGKYAHIPTTEERLPETFQADSEEDYMMHAEEVYKATGSEAAFPHPDQTISITNRRKVKDEYKISDEEWPAYQDTYKDAYVRYMNKYGKRWDSLPTEKKKQILSNAHSAGNDAMRKKYTREHRDIDLNSTGQYGLGNIDLNNRVVVQNDDGSFSTEDSISFYDEETGKEVLVPRIVNGKRVSDDEAIQNYYNTGEYLGMFNSPAQADAYAEKLHNRQEWYYGR